MNGRLILTALVAMTVAAVCRAGVSVDSAPASTFVGRRLQEICASQNADGSWSQDDALVDSSLCLLALLHHGVVCCSGRDRMCVPSFTNGMEFLRRCAIQKAGFTRFRGEEADPRAFLMAACAVVEYSALSHNPGWRETADGCVCRLMKEDFPCLSAVLDEKSADELRWLIMALGTAKNGGWKNKSLDVRLKRAEDRLNEVGTEDNGYYEAWSQYRRVFILWEGPDADFQWEEGSRARRARLFEQEKHGFGSLSEMALAALQLAWPVSRHFPPADKHRSQSTNTVHAVSIEI